MLCGALAAPTAGSWSVCDPLSRYQIDCKVTCSPLNRMATLAPVKRLRFFTGLLGCLTVLAAGLSARHALVTDMRDPAGR